MGVLEKSGVAHKEDRSRLIDCAKKYGLTVTFHRAFDATPDWQQSINTLVSLGFDRILSGGIPWGERGIALDGVDQLSDMVAFAGNRIEVVVGGGVNCVNAPLVVEALGRQKGQFSLHAYSALLEEDNVSVQRVKQLCRVLDGSNR